MPRQRLMIALLVSALIAGCSKTSSPPTPSAAEASTPAAGQDTAASRHFAGLLPADTIAYGRLRDAGTLKDRWVQPGLLTDAEPVRQQLTQWYAGLLDSAGRNNPFGLPPETVQEFAGSLRSVHVAVVAADNRLQEPALFFEMANGAVVSKIRQQLAGRATEKVLQGAKVLDLTTLPGQPAQTLYVLDDTVLVAGPDPVLAQVIAARTGGRKHSLAEVEAFRKVETELGRTGDLFVYFSAGDLRAALLREIDADSTPAAPQVATAEVRTPFLQDQRERNQRRRAEIENIPFKEIGHVGASMGVDGSLTVRAYTLPGKKLPDFLVRRPAEKQLFRRIPADALLAYAWTYEGGKQTRKAFSEWLKEEMKAEGTSLVPAPLAQVVTQQLDRLEADVVVMAQDLWVAALPVKTELAFALALDASGRWGVLLGFDVEDRAQAEKLRQQLFETGRRHNLAWKETTHEGLTIRYLDLEEMLEKDGARLPPELAEQVQLKVGYALGDELFLVGSVEAIKFAHRPAGPVLADVVKRDHIDAANTFHLTLQPGRFLHGTTRIPPVDKLLQVLRRQVPKDASWSITLNLQEDQATLRGNVPFAALAAWVGLDLSEFAQALR